MKILINISKSASIAILFSFLGCVQIPIPKGNLTPTDLQISVASSQKKPNVNFIIEISEPGQVGVTETYKQISKAVEEVNNDYSLFNTLTFEDLNIIDSNYNIRLRLSYGMEYSPTGLSVTDHLLAVAWLTTFTLLPVPTHLNYILEASLYDKEGNQLNTYSSYDSLLKISNASAARYYDIPYNMVKNMVKDSLFKLVNDSQITTFYLQKE